MRQGLTLVEIVLVLVVAGLLFGIALPRTRRMLDQVAVHGAAREIAAAHARARIMAVVQNRAIILTIASDTMFLRPRNDTTTLWSSSGPARQGIVLPGGPRQVMFSPVGLVMGVSNATYQLSRGAATRRVIVSRLGRVRFAP